MIKEGILKMGRIVTKEVQSSIDDLCEMKQVLSVNVGKFNPKANSKKWPSGSLEFRKATSTGLEVRAHANTGSFPVYATIVLQHRTYVMNYLADKYQQR